MGQGREETVEMTEGSRAKERKTGSGVRGPLANLNGTGVHRVRQEISDFVGHSVSVFATHLCPLALSILYHLAQQVNQEE